MFGIHIMQGDIGKGLKMEEKLSQIEIGFCIYVKLQLLLTLQEYIGKATVDAGPHRSLLCSGNFAFIS